MATDDKINNEKLQYDINQEAGKISAESYGKLININILLVKKYYHLIKVEKQYKQILHIPLSVKHLKNK